MKNKTLNKQVVFSAHNFFQKIRNYVLCLIGIMFIIYCFYHLSENPIVIGIAISFILIMLIVNAYSKIIVYSDEVVFIAKHPIDVLSKKWHFQFDDLCSIDANLQLTKKGFLLFETLSYYLPGNSVWNTIALKLKDGSKKIINTKIYKKDLLIALDIISKKSRGKIDITGINS